MVLPTFIGIGATKCGSTWLHELLQQHSAIYMPTKRKEINYFNSEENYQKGLGWYESFFPSEERAQKYQAIGEFTPMYLYQSEKCSKRISSLKSVEKLVVILRNPTSRVYSQYCHALRAGQNRGSFSDFLEDRPWTINQSLYAKNIQPFFDYYSSSDICCFIFEESIKDISLTKEKITSFLGVSSGEFATDSGVKQVNSSYVPRMKWLNKWAGKVNRKLVEKDLDWVVNLGKSVGINQLLKVGSNKITPLDAENKQRLDDIFSQDIENLEKLLKINLDIWRTP